MFGNHFSSYIILAFSLIDYAHLQQTNQDLAEHGNYLIYNCGSQVEAVQSVLDQTYGALEEAIQDINKAQPLKTKVYNTFFSGVNPNLVKTALQSMAGGTSIWTPEKKYQHPVVTCVDGRNPKLQRYWTRCLENPARRASTIDKFPIVVLCPSFFTDMAQYPSSNFCAKVVAAGTQLSHSFMVFTQLTTLVHEFMHVYGPRPALLPEIYDVNSCMALSAADSVKNPSNYAFYVGNVYARCSQFPTSPIRGPGRKLGAGDDASAFVGEIIEPTPVCTSNPILVELGACS